MQLLVVNNSGDDIVGLSSDVFLFGFEVEKKIFSILHDITMRIRMVVIFSFLKIIIFNFYYYFFIFYLFMRSESKNGNSKDPFTNTNAWNLKSGNSVLIFLFSLSPFLIMACCNKK